MKKTSFFNAKLLLQIILLFYAVKNIFALCNEFDGFQLKISWDHSDQCNLTSLFQDNELSSGCVEVKDSLQISTEYQFKIPNSSDNFQSVNLVLDLDMLMDVRASINDTKKDVFLNWNAKNNSYKLIGTECNLRNDILNCSKNFNILQPYPYVKFTNFIERVGIISNDNLSLLFDRGYLIAENFDIDLDSPGFRIFAENSEQVDIQIDQEGKADIKHLKEFFNKSIELAIFGYNDLSSMIGEDKNVTIQLG